MWVWVCCEKNYWTASSLACPPGGLASGGLSYSNIPRSSRHLAHHVTLAPSPVVSALTRVTHREQISPLRRRKKRDGSGRNDGMCVKHIYFEPTHISNKTDHLQTQPFAGLGFGIRYHRTTNKNQGRSMQDRPKSFKKRILPLTPAE